ncbi:MAG: 4Fe-4S ferredoxin [Oscillospiraceae bacterium]|jgi:carbon-monoxide dehydrogenase iron sulfur subunit|nr:4Fe-4S ferredoxin [Oscillospiraceae bacterium]
MRRVFVNEEWCLGCHLCEYHCANANMGGVTAQDMVRNLRGKKIHPRIRVEDGADGGKINFAVQCRHCYDPMCVKSCIAGALTVEDGVVTHNPDKCVGCFTCVLTCPYGCVMPDGDGKVVQKCELCLRNKVGAPACAEHCPNRAIVYEERGTL